MGFWQGKNVFLTGHSGFKGAWLTLWLQELGANVTGYSLPPVEGGIFERLVFSSKVCSYFEDIRNIDVLRLAIKDAKPNIIIHLAAQPLVLESYSDPVKTYETNVIGTANLLQILREIENIEATLVVTSDKCYQNDGRGKYFSESDPMGGRDPYSSSKACQELVVQSFRDSFAPGGDNKFPALATARAGNVIGGGDTARDRLLPDILKSLKNNKKIQIRNPNSVRPWQHVLDPLFGYLLLCQKLVKHPKKYSGAWNFGPKTKRKQDVSQVVAEFMKCWGGKNIFEFSPSGEQLEELELNLNVEKAFDLLEWNAIYDLDMAILKTVEWEKRAVQSSEMTEFSLRQITEYMDTVEKNLFKCF